MKPFSHRTSFDIAPNAWAEARARAPGPLVDLTETNPTRAGLPYQDEAILCALADPRALTYEPHALGLPAAREAIARLHAWPRDRIVVTASTSESYSLLFKLLCDAGDEVLVPRPSYPLFEHLARFEHVSLVPYPLAYDGAWHIDASALHQARTTRTRAIVVVHPNNPTGSYVRRDELHLLASLDLPVISDEVFSAYALEDDAARASSLLELSDRLVFSLGGLSKYAALPQLKAGWMLIGGPEQLAQKAIDRLEVLCDTYLSVGTPVQCALDALLTATNGTRAAIGARVRKNLIQLGRALEGTSAHALRVEGGWSAIVRIPAITTDDAFALELLQKDAVLVHPGSFYDLGPAPHLVVSLLTPESVFAEGARRIAHRTRDLERV